MADEKPVAEIVPEFRERLRKGRDAKTKFDSAAETYHAFYGGDQWEEEDVSALKAQHRPALTFNQCLSVINAVSGSEITRRFEPKYLPRTMDDQALSDMISDTVRYIRQGCAAEHEDSLAFRDCAISGMGCTETRQDYTEDPAGKTLTECVSTFTVFWDPYAQRMNLKDSRWVARGKWIPMDEAEARWPESADQIKAEIDSESALIPRGHGEVHDNTQDLLYTRDLNHYYNRPTDEVLVWHYQRYALAPYMVFEDMDGRMKFISPEDFDRLSERMNGQVPPAIKVRKKNYDEAFILGNILLEERTPPIQSGFTYQFISGFGLRQRGGMEWFGLMKMMMDPQNWANKMVSQLVHIINTNPKGSIMAPRSLFEDPDSVGEEWAKPSGRIFTQDGSNLATDLRIIEGRYPSSQERMLEIASEAIPRVVGFNPFSVSSVEDLSRVATSAIRTVQSQGMVVLSVLFDSLRSYRKDGVGPLYLEFIKAFMPEGKMIRVTQPTGQQQPIPFERTWVDDVDYDVVVDEAPASTTAMQELWDSLQQTQSLEILMQNGVLTPDIIVDIMPGVPESIRNRMRNNAAQQNIVGQVFDLVASGDNEGAIALIQQNLEQQGA